MKQTRVLHEKSKESCRIGFKISVPQVTYWDPLKQKGARMVSLTLIQLKENAGTVWRRFRGRC